MVKSAETETLFVEKRNYKRRDDRLGLTTSSYWGPPLVVNGVFIKTLTFWFKSDGHHGVLSAGNKIFLQAFP